MDAELQPVYRQLSEAEHPEEVFGSEDIVLPANLLLDFLQDRFDKLRKICDPSRYSDPDDADAATETAEKLERLHAEAQSRIRLGYYGFPGFGKPIPSLASKSFLVGKRNYHIGTKLEDGESFATYQAFLKVDDLVIGEVMVKLTASAGSNYLAEREARNLHLLHRVEVPQWKHLPLLLDTFHSAARMGLIERKMSGYSLTEVRKHALHADGVDQRHMVWMLDRALSCLGYVHSQGIVHGSISPDALLIVPANHNVLIRDWQHAVVNPARSGERVENIDEIFSAPELKNRGEIGPWSDIYSLGKTIIWLLGGNPVTNKIPSGVEAPIAGFLRKLVDPSHHSRPAKAWELYEQQRVIKDKLWPRKFLHFDMS